MHKLLFVLAIIVLQSCTSDYHIRKFDGTTVLDYGPASKIKHYYQHRNLGENLEISVRPEKESYYPLEEMAVLITLTNTSSVDSLRVNSPDVYAISFQNEAGKRFNNCCLGKPGCGYISILYSDVLGRSVKNVRFPGRVLPPGESATARFNMRISPSTYLFRELESKAMGVPGVIPVGSYTIRYSHLHMEFDKERLPATEKLFPSMQQPVQIVEPEGRVKEQIDRLLELTQQAKDAGGMLGGKRATAKVLRDGCLRLRADYPDVIFPDLLERIISFCDSVLNYKNESQKL